MVYKNASLVFNKKYWFHDVFKYDQKYETVFENNGVEERKIYRVY